MVRVVDEDIINFIYATLDEKPKEVIPRVTERFGVTRQTVSTYLARLIRQGMVVGKGTTSARRYSLKVLDEFVETVAITPGMADDLIWRTKIAPRLDNILSENVEDICRYAFTEMFNNVIDHSESPNCLIRMTRNAFKVEFLLSDFGVGIFEKIRKAFDLEDRRHALLELSKGKLTTDSSKHSGQGIFFTSRAMDTFSLLSGDLFYSKRRSDDGWLIEVDEADWVSGTWVRMSIQLATKRTLKDVFDKFSSGEDYGFTKTHLPISLAKYEGEKLVSRSQAKRLLARVEKFKEVVLDFKGVDSIGQAFADEIFRVFAGEHTDITFYPINASDEIMEMIKRAKSQASSEGQRSLF